MNNEFNVGHVFATTVLAGLSAMQLNGERCFVRKIAKTILNILCYFVKTNKTISFYIKNCITLRTKTLFLVPIVIFMLHIMNNYVWLSEIPQNIACLQLPVVV